MEMHILRHIRIVVDLHRDRHALFHPQQRTGRSAVVSDGAENAIRRQFHGDRADIQREFGLGDIGRRRRGEKRLRLLSAEAAGGRGSRNFKKISSLHESSREQVRGKNAWRPTLDHRTATFPRAHSGASSAGGNLLFLRGRCVFQRLHVRKIVIFLMTGGFAKLELFALYREGDGPRLRVHHGVGDGHLVGDGIRIRGSEALSTCSA